MRALKDMRIGRRLLAAFAVVTAMLVGGTAMAVWSIRHVNASGHRVLDSARAINLTQEISKATDTISRCVAQTLLLEDPKAKEAPRPRWPRRGTTISGTTRNW